MMRFVLVAFSLLSAPLYSQQLQESLARRYVSILEKAGNGDYDGALSNLYTFVNEAPWFTQAYSRIAAFAFYTHQTDKADSFFIRTINLNPANALFGRGLVAKYRMRYRDAIAFFNVSIHQAPQCLFPYLALAECYQFDKTISLDEIVRTFDSLSHSHGSYSAPLIGLSELYYRDIKKDFGFSYAERALRFDSSAYVKYYYCRAKAYSVSYNYRVYPRNYSDIHALLEEVIPKIKKTDDQLYALAHHLLGLICQLRMDIRYGQEYAKSYEISRRFGNKEQMSIFLGSMGKFDAAVGNYHQAAERQIRAALLSHEVNRLDYEALNLREAAFALYLLGNYREAIAYYKKVGDLQSQIRNIDAYEYYRKVSTIYQELQDYPHALDFTERAIDVLDSNNYAYGYPIIMQTRGEILLADNQKEAALKAFQSGLQVLQHRLSQDYRAGMLTLGLANVYSALGKEKEADRAFQKSGRFLEQFTDSKAPYYLALARFHVKYGRLHQAISTYQKLLWYYAKEDWDINYDGLVTAYEEQGNTFTTIGNIDSALSNYAAGIRTIERLRTKVHNEFQAAQILSRHINLYTNSAHLLALQGKTEEAFQISERARARTLQDRISTGTMKFSTNIPDSLRVALFSVDQQLQDLNSRLFNAIRDLSDEGIIRKLQDSVDLVEISRQRINEEMTRLSGETASPQFLLLTPEDIHRRIGESDALISYIRSTNGYGAFVITNTGTSYIRLSIDRDTLIHLVESVSPRLSSKTNGRENSTPRIRSSYNLYEAARLSAMIVSPLASYLKGKKNLVIIPDDILHYVPFEALPLSLPGTSSQFDFEHVEFLLHRYTIHYLPSASAIGWDFSHRTHAEERLLAIGNPDFGVVLSSSRENKGAKLTRRFQQEFPDSVIPSLPYTGDEVHAIGSLIEGSKQLTGSEATVDRFKIEASRYQILHIATHYFIDDRQPLFSRLMFAPMVSEQQASYFQTFELYQMRLNADLTVLSACNTALGLLQRGEGLNGITQAFMTAGSSSLVVSLWSVDDQSTSILMKYFYTGLLSGKTKADALREAKLQLIQDGYGDPLYWAGFILMGDNTPLKLVPIAYPGWGTLGCILLTLLILTFLTIHSHRMSKRKERV